MDSTIPSDCNQSVTVVKLKASHHLTSMPTSLRLSYTHAQASCLQYGLYAMALKYLSRPALHHSHCKLTVCATSEFTRVYELDREECCSAAVIYLLLQALFRVKPDGVAHDQAYLSRSGSWMRTYQAQVN